MSHGIWIFEEHDIHGTKNITLELLSEGQKLARRLKEELCVCLFGHQVTGLIPQLSQFGAAKVYLVDSDLLSEYNLDTYSLLLGDLIREYEPSFLMMGATPLGSERAPRVAARQGLPCITEVKQIKGSNENLQVIKSTYNDQLYATIRPVPKRPLIITIPPGETDITKAGETKEVVVIRKDLEFSDEVKRVRYRRFIKGDPRTISIAEADRIVAVGNGVDSKSFPIIEELADILESSIGGSRVAVDKNIIPFERQIGITGKTVMPKLLVACGISGAYEFTDGMRDSKAVIAVNKDGNARIFKFANLCLKGDVYEIIPRVIDQLKAHKKTTGKDS